MMKNNIKQITSVAILLLISCCSNLSFAQQRHEYLLKDNWKFMKGDPEGAAGLSCDTKSWKIVTIPHDWAIEGPFDINNDIQEVQITENNEKNKSVKSGRTGGLPFVGVGWYRRVIDGVVFKAGQRAVLLFDGAMSYPKIFINGKEAGHWAYGYNSFSIDISSFLKPGETNLLAVRLENLPEASRWYPGTGLYRNVHLIITDEVHIPVWGAYITTPVINPGYAKVNIKTRIEGQDTIAKQTATAKENGTGKQKLAGNLKLNTQIKDAAGRVVSETNSTLTATDESQFEQQLIVKAPSLWSPETPVLYTAVSKLYAGDELKDSYETTFGFRTIKFEPVKGFSLNGQYRKFKGVCNHHDLGPLGAAVNVAALRRQLTLLKDMGCDAIRTSHNMPAPELVKLCDEMGFMLMVESFDEWKTPKVKNGYHTLFDEWAEKDLVNMVQRDRNHPSVVLWSIGNEVRDQDVVNGNKLITFLQDICHREDPTRPVTMGMNHIENALNNNFASAIDIPGFNYKPDWYERANTRLPQGFILGTETVSTVSSRGVYKFPVALHSMKTYADNQSSSYDVEFCDWSQIPDDEFAKQDSLGFVIGEFVWTGFDYLGEPTPYDEQWPSHSSYFGILDLAGLPKDRYYLYRSKWNTEKPTLHILPHWTFPGREGLVTPVFVYTSYPAAELFINGKSMGKQTKNSSSSTSKYRLMWKNVTYQPGTVKVIAYDNKGKAVAEETIHTAGKPDHIVLEADRDRLTADGQDLSYVTAKIVDKEGNLCPDASSKLHFKVSGAGTYKVAANGDATSLESFQDDHMKAFHGMLVVTVQSGTKEGKINLTVSADQLRNANIYLLSSKSVLP